MSDRLHNDRAHRAWVRGYTDAYNGRDVNEPEGHRTEYLRGYIAGLKALKIAT